MKMHSWIRNLFARPVNRPFCRAQFRARPALEVLEDRWVPSAIVVNNPTDTPVAGLIDLRQAIAMANTNVGDDTITFDKTVFNTPKTITLGGTQLELTDTTGATTITGPNKGVTVDAGGNSRVFQVDPSVTASISGMTITGGNTAGTGGGLYNDRGTLTLTNCTVNGNTSTQGGLLLAGGGLANYFGTTKLSNCTVSGNSAQNEAGGGLSSAGGTLTLTYCNVLGSSAP